MQTEQPTKCFPPLQKRKARMDAIKHVQAPSSNSLLTLQRRYFCCGSLDPLPISGVRFSAMFQLMFVKSIFSSVWVAEWSPFGKKLPTWLTICSLCILTICDFSYFPFWFFGRDSGSLLLQFLVIAYLSRVMRKPTFCICENKDADQLSSNREADQRLCFRYIDSTISLLSKSEISSF